MQKPRTRQEDILAEEVQGECVVYDPKLKKAHHLNAPLTWIWKNCDGTRTIDELVLAMQVDTGYSDTRDVIADGLKQLGDADLLEPESVDLSSIVPKTGISRRAVIAGASAVAPVISSILAPTPAAAKSKPDKSPKPPKDNGNKGKKGG